MSLSILVAYLLGDGDEALLDLHLHRIERHTRTPYTIHAAVIRLPEASIRRLEEHPRVRLHSIEPPAAWATCSEEHSHYLEQLADRAIDEGADRIVTLHPDSFPIRDGWDEDLFALLNDDAVVGTVAAVDTACLFFREELWTSIRPSFLMPPFETDPQHQTRFFDTYPVVNHSGTGLVYAAFLEGWRTVFLPEDPVHPMAGRFCGFYCGVIFHLGGVARLLVERTTGLARGPSAPGFSRLRLTDTVETLFVRASRALGHNAPIYRARARRNGGRAWSTSGRLRVTGRFFRHRLEQDYLDAKRALLRDPEGYLGNPGRYHVSPRNA